MAGPRSVTVGTCGVAVLASYSALTFRRVRAADSRALTDTSTRWRRGRRRAHPTDTSETRRPTTRETARRERAKEKGHAQV